MRITALRTVPYTYAASRPLSDVNFPEGRQEQRTTALFIDTDEGITGVAVHGSPESAIRPFEHLLVGRDPRGVRDIYKRMVDEVFKVGNRGATAGPIATIDEALWDLKAKAHGEPLWRTLGASEGRVRAYASDIGIGLSDDELRAYYRKMAGFGVSAGKLKVGHDPEADLRRLGIMQAELARSGKTPLLCIDSNEYWSPKQAIISIRELERHYPIYWAEEPADRWDYRGLAKVSAGITAQVATGENLKDPTEIGPLIEHGAMDVFEPNPKGMGVTGALIASDTCYTYRIPVAMMNSPGNYAAHVAAALPNHMMMEVPDLGRDVWFTVDAEIHDGDIVLGDTPGFGFTLDLAKLDELSRRPSPKAHAGLMPRRRGAGVIPSPVRDE
jgi:L-alanine-DL-glutamate epimerase-like enolase superfamily enzyme